MNRLRASNKTLCCLDKLVLTPSTGYIRIGGELFVGEGVVVHLFHFHPFCSISYVVGWYLGRGDWSTSKDKGQTGVVRPSISIRVQTC